ncbi:MAG: outer membrane beta-barrel protein [Bacteroidota bacterium]|nr:outer membrane beta-barrel protein [Bacteroidota bacterium]
MKRFILFFIFIGYLNVSAQNITVKGQVVSSADKSPLTGATVQLLSVPSSANTPIKGAVTDSKGRFAIDGLKKSGKYQLTISYISFDNYTQIMELRGKSIDLGTILLSPSSIQTNEVEIVAKIPPAVQKGDTSEFNADAFKVNKDASTEDLIAKMPGVTVQDGKVQAHGEDVKRVLVDGKPFFGDDPSAVLKNVPAEIVEKIQVFDQQSEQAQFTGFDDGNQTKTINIVTRLRIKEGTFGKFTGGYGNDERYKTGASINFFNDDQRISLLGQINNVNEQNFTPEDLAGVMSSPGRSGGGRRGGDGGPRGQMGGGRGGFSGGGGSGNFGGGGNAQDFLVSSKGGLTNTKAFGLNYQNKFFDKIDLTGSYFFNLSDNNADSKVNRQYFENAYGSQLYNESNSSVSTNTNHRLNLRVDYQIDSSNSIMLRPKLSVQLNNGTTDLTGSTSNGNRLLNFENNTSSSDYKALNFSNELLFRHRFETRGRTLSVGFNSGYKKTKGNSDLFSENLYYDKILTADTLNQYANLDKNGFNGSTNVVYTEPIGENSMIQFNTALSYSEDKSDQRTYNNSDTTTTDYLLIPELSNVYKKIYRTQSFGTGYRFQKEGLSMMLGVNYNISDLQNDGSYPYALQIEKKFYSLLPSFMMRYNISRDQNLHFFYRANNNAPSVEQLQNVIDNSNPIQLSTGNPELKQDNSHSFSLRYSKINFSNMNSFFVMLGGSFTQNYIGNSTTIAYKDTVLPGGIALKQGSQLSRPENIDGYINLRSFFTYSLPVSFLMSNFNLMTSATYTRTPGIINGTTSYSNSQSYSLGFVLSSNISPDIDFSISSNSSYNNVKSTISSSNAQEYFNQNSRLKLFWNFWEGFFIQGDLTHQYDNGLSSSYNRNSLLCNMSFGKKFFANEQAEIRLSVYDLFNQNTNISRNSTDSYIEDTRTNVLGRYWLLTFSYNLKAF